MGFQSRPLCSWPVLSLNSRERRPFPPPKIRHHPWVTPEHTWAFCTCSFPQFLLLPQASASSLDRLTPPDPRTPPLLLSLSTFPVKASLSFLEPVLVCVCSVSVTCSASSSVGWWGWGLLWEGAVSAQPPKGQHPAPPPVGWSCVSAGVSCRGGLAAWRRAVGGFGPRASSSYSRPVSLWWRLGLGTVRCPPWTCPLVDKTDTPRVTVVRFLCWGSWVLGLGGGWVAQARSP